MKKLIRISCLCLTSCLSYGQSEDMHRMHSRILYTINFQNDSSDSKSLVIEEAELLFNDSISIFRSINFGYMDSLSQEVANGTIAHDETNRLHNRYPYKLTFQILKTLNGIHKYEKLAGANNKIVKTSEIQDSFNWEIKPDTMTILGFLTQKACMEYGGRRWEAWFSPDIPINEGPYKFNNLPGLILLVKDSTKTWSFTLSGIQRNLNRNVLFTKSMLIKEQDMTEEQLYKTKQYLRDHEFEITLSEGRFQGVESQVLERLKVIHKRRAKKDNNWIELYP